MFNLSKTVRGIAAVVMLAALFAGSPTLGADGEELVLRRGWVPDETKPQGEVRALSRAGAEVAQTVLRSKVLRRVVARIAAKERKNWPPDCEHHDAATAYVDALVRAEAALRHERRSGDLHTDRRRGLLIEFVHGNGTASVLLYVPEIEDVDGAWRVTDRTLIEELRLDAGYVERNIRLIAADAFGIGLEEANDLFARP